MKQTRAATNGLTGGSRAALLGAAHARGSGAAAGARPPAAASQIMSELRVSGHLMRLDPGLFCVLQTPTPGADATSGLPGVRLSLSPGAGSHHDRVQISGFGPGGWLSGSGDAALVRVFGGPAQILVTIYQGREAPDGVAPNLQVLRLLDPGSPGARPAAPPIGAAAPAPRAMEMLAHVQERGDVGAMLGDRLGERGSKRWIEGFALAPAGRVAPNEIEYQAVLGPGWLSPWVEGGQFCGSRAMALPVLGLRVRLRGEAAKSYRVGYEASFVDGSEIGPVGDGESCEATSLAAMESFRVALHPRARPAAANMQPSKVEAPAVKAGKTRAGKIQAGKIQAGKTRAGKIQAGKAAPAGPMLAREAQAKAASPVMAPARIVPGRTAHGKTLPPRAGAGLPPSAGLPSNGPAPARAASKTALARPKPPRR